MIRYQFGRHLVMVSAQPVKGRERVGRESGVFNRRRVSVTWVGPMTLIRMTLPGSRR